MGSLRPRSRELTSGSEFELSAEIRPRVAPRGSEKTWKAGALEEEIFGSSHGKLGSLEETRSVSRETWSVSRETRFVSREAQFVSREAQFVSRDLVSKRPSAL